MDRPVPHVRESQRLINRRQQGDLGEASAIEWLHRIGATVSLPFGYSPDYDLVAEIDGQLLRIQVKTSTSVEITPNGHRRYQVHIATNGGNQSWSGVAKKFDPSRFDVLYAVVADGRRWLIPASQIEAETNISLGGPKYSAFEIDSTTPISSLVYGEGSPTLESDSGRGSAGVGEPGRSVKSVPKLLVGSIPTSPTPKHGLSRTAVPAFEIRTAARQVWLRGHQPEAPRDAPSAGADACRPSRWRLRPCASRWFGADRA